MIGLILDKLQRLIDAETGETDEAPILPDQAKGYFSSYFQAWPGRRKRRGRAPRPVVSHWQDTRSRTLRFAGHFFATVNRLIDPVEYKKMRPSLYWPYCSACITT